MISESLMINTTLTELDLSCEDKIMEEEIKIGKERVNETDNEQLTILEMKELR